MHRSLAALAVLALGVGVPAGAVAKKPRKDKKPTPRAKTLRATLEPVGVDAAYAGIAGKAQLVDGKRNDKVSIHVRNLKPGTVHPWHVHQAPAGAGDPCAEGAPQGPIVTAFRYRTLRANAGGNANSFGRSRSFTADRGETYYVNVHEPATGRPIACGVLKAKKARKQTSKRRGSAKKRGSSKSGDRRRSDRR